MALATIAALKDLFEVMGEKLEETESAETVLADWLTSAGIEDIDQHILFRMAGEKAGKNFDELFLIRDAGLFETFADV